VFGHDFFSCVFGGASVQKGVDLVEQFFDMPEIAHVAPADHRLGMPGELVLDLREQGGDAANAGLANQS